MIFSFRYLPRPSWVIPRCDGDADVRHVGELDRVVLPRPDRLGEVFADLLLVDVEGGDEFDVADVVAAEFDVHQAGDFLGRVGVLVVLDALDEGVGAVADPDDRDADLSSSPPLPVCSVALTHKFCGSSWIALSGKGHPAPLLVTGPPRRRSSRSDARLHPDELVAHMPDALEDREDGQRGEHVDRRGEEFEIADSGALGEDQADRK